MPRRRGANELNSKQWQAAHSSRSFDSLSMSPVARNGPSFMTNRAFNMIVVLFWLATMTWLVSVKVLPPMRVGEPPDYASIIDESIERPPVCWSIHLQDRPIGWAASKVVLRRDGVSEVTSRVYLGDLPWEDLAPTWLAGVLKPVFDDLGPLDIDKRSRLVIDPLGRPVDFDSRVRVANLPDAIRVKGQIEGSTLSLEVKSGELVYKRDCYLPPGALLTDELSPQGLMPRLRVGQRWTVPLYSPLRAANNPIEILEAVVDREDTIRWAGKVHPCRVIIYRSDAGSGLMDRTRGRVWVRNDGLVLQQEVSVLKSDLRFVRLSDERAEPIYRALGEEWNRILPKETAKELLELASGTDG